MSEAVLKALHLTAAAPVQKAVPRQRAAAITFTSNQLKVIAIVAMVFDHSIIAFVPHELAVYQFLRLPGKLTAPIMCFLIAEGYYHTSSLRRYLGRLAGMAVISHLPFTLCFGYDPLQFWTATDVMWSLFFGLLALSAWERKGWLLRQKMFAVALCCLFSYSADWNYIAVLMVLGFGIFHQHKNRQTAVHLAVGGLYLAQGLWYGSSLAARAGIFLSVPLLRRYNGQRGRKSSWIKWGFYWFYPVHLAILYLLKQEI